MVTPTRVLFRKSFQSYLLKNRLAKYWQQLTHRIKELEKQGFMFGVLPPKKTTLPKCAGRTLNTDIFFVDKKMNR